MDLLSRFSKFDAFSKSKSEVQVRTATGAVLSFIALLCAGLLLSSEFGFYRSKRIENHLLVDTSQGDRAFDIHLDIEFPSLSCRLAAVAAEDAKGTPYDHSAIDIKKTPLDAAGRPIRGFATTSNAKQEMAPGCRLTGTLRVKRVAGNFHISSADYNGASLQQMLMAGILPFQNPEEDGAHKFNASHRIHKLDFGSVYPGQVHPLDGRQVVHTTAAIQQQYHIKVCRYIIRRRVSVASALTYMTWMCLQVVPTIYEPLYGSTLQDANQISATDFTQVMDINDGVYIHPGVWFK
jgi:hypothetical protein